MNEKHTRLRQAREAAGFKEATHAAHSLGIPVPTYASHENGSRGFRADRAEQYARRFGVSTEWLLYGRGESKRAKPAGMAEPDVTPIDYSTYKTRRKIESRPENVASFLTTNGAMGFGIRPHSVILVDLKDLGQTGDYVIASVDDRDHGFSTTILRRLVAGHLIPDGPGDPEPITDNVTIRGRIIQVISDL